MTKKSTTRKKTVSKKTSKKNTKKAVGKKTKKKVVAKKTKKKTTKKVAKKTTARKKVTTKAVKGLVFDYNPAPESSAIVTIKKKYDHFINGAFVSPESGQYMNTINPATADVLTKFAVGNEKDVDKAVKAARKAYEGTWSKLSGAERGKFLYRIARILQERAREFAVLETMDGGKPIKESRDVDIPLAAAHFFYYAGWADKLEYAFPGKEVNSIGVCGQIIPWNFPLLMAAWKIAPALAAGNTIVLKPAEQTPLTALLLAEVCQEAELPDGVVNIVTGAGLTGAALVDHKDVNKIAFTGSTDIGKMIARNVARTNKKLTLELGGKSANIIYEDAAIDQAVEGVVNGIYFKGITAALHGNELNGISTIFKLIEEVNPKKLSGTLVLIPISNVPGYLMNQRHFSDNVDLNRIMPGAPKGLASSIYANKFVEKLITKFDYLLELNTESHGRVNSLYLRADIENEETRTLAFLQNPQIIVKKFDVDGTLRSWANENGIPCITIEIGNANAFQHSLIDETLEGILNTMKYLKMIKGRVKDMVTNAYVCDRSYWIYSSKGGIIDVIPNLADEVKKDQIIAKIYDVFGQVREEVIADMSGVVIGKNVRPNCEAGTRILHLGVNLIDPEPEDIPGHDDFDGVEIEN